MGEMSFRTERYVFCVLSGSLEQHMRSTSEYSSVSPSTSLPKRWSPRDLRQGGQAMNHLITQLFSGVLQPLLRFFSPTRLTASVDPSLALWEKDKGRQVWVIRAPRRPRGLQAKLPGDFEELSQEAFFLAPGRFRASTWGGKGAGAESDEIPWRTEGQDGLQQILLHSSGRSMQRHSRVDRSVPVTPALADVSHPFCRWLLAALLQRISRPIRPMFRPNSCQKHRRCRSLGYPEPWRLHRAGQTPS